MPPHESEQPELVEMVGRMVADERLRILRIHHTVEAMVDLAREGFHPGQRLQEKRPFIAEIEHSRFIRTYGLQGPHVPRCAPERFDDEPPEKQRTEQARQETDTGIHADGAQIQLHEAGTMSQHAGCIEDAPSRPGIGFKPIQSRAQRFEGRGIR